MLGYFTSGETTEPSSSETSLAQAQAIVAKAAGVSVDEFVKSFQSKYQDGQVRARVGTSMDPAAFHAAVNNRESLDVDPTDDYATDDYATDDYATDDYATNDYATDTYATNKVAADEKQATNWNANNPSSIAHSSQSASSNSDKIQVHQTITPILGHSETCDCEAFAKEELKNFKDVLKKKKLFAQQARCPSPDKPAHLGGSKFAATNSTTPTSFALPRSDSTATDFFALPGSFVLSFLGIMMTWTLLWLFSLWRGSSAFKAFFGVVPAVLSSLFVFAYLPSIATPDLGLPSFVSSKYTLMALRYPCLAAGCLLVLDVIGLLALASECGRNIVRWWKGDGWRFGWGWTTDGGQRRRAAAQVVVATVPAPWDMPVGQFI